MDISFIYHLIYVLFYINLTVGQQLILNGDYFNGDERAEYKNAILNCDDNSICTVNCIESDSCYNTTVNCPSDPSYGCIVSCNGRYVCNYININWNNYSPNNRLTCGQSGCRRSLYPPPVNDTTPFIVNCDQDLCDGMNIICPLHAVCNVTCYGCGETVIHCPLTADCNIQCLGQGSCYEAFAYWSSDVSLSSLVCSAQSSCNPITASSIIDGAPINNLFECNNLKQCASSIFNCQQDEDCIIDCISAENNVCTTAIMNCPKNADCYILCDGYEACKHATINGPIDHKLEIICDGFRGCDHLTIYGQYSNYFNLTIIEGLYTTWGLSIYVPPKNGDTKRAFITGGFEDNNGANHEGAYNPVQIYAINGFDDVLISSLTDQYYSKMIMHCHTDYLRSCWFANDSYNSCNDRNTICNHPNSTKSPTKSPTKDPVPHLILIYLLFLCPFCKNVNKYNFVNTCIKIISYMKMLIDIKFDDTTTLNALT